MNRLLFARESPRPAALMRIGVGLVLLWDAAVRWPYVVELYSSSGMPMPLFPGTALEPYAPPAPAAVALYALLLFALACVALGWQTRTSLATAFVLSGWFGLLDSPGTFKKYSVLGLHLLLLLVFTQCSAVWSVDALARRKRGQVALSPRWPRLLMGVLVSAVYLGAVVTKMRLPDFGSGDLLTFSLLDRRWGGGRFGMWLAMQPMLMMFLSYATTLFELAAALLLWVPRTRRAMLVLALLFHASLGVVMHIGVFSPMMFVALLAFARESDIAWLRRPFARSAGRNRGGISKTSETAPGTAGPDGCRRGKSATRERAESAESARRNADSGEHQITRHSPATTPIRNPQSAIRNETKGRRSSLLRWGCYLGAAAVAAAAGIADQYLQGHADVFGPRRPPQWVEIDGETRTAIQLEEPPPLRDAFFRFEIGSRLGFRHAFGKRDGFRPGEAVVCIARLQRRHRRMWLLWTLEDPLGEERARELRPLERRPTYVSQAFVLPRANVPAGRWAIVLTAVAVQRRGRLLAETSAPEEIARIPFDVSESK